MSVQAQIPLTLVPQGLKPISPLIKIANEFSRRDVVIFYWSLMKATEDAIKLGVKTAEEQAFLIKLLDVLEKIKKEEAENDAIRSRLVANAHIDEFALKLFSFAEQCDSNAVFDNKMMQAFYTSGYLYELLRSKTLHDDPDEVDDTVLEREKFAKWRATTIFNCFRNGETPVPAPRPAAPQQPAAGLQGDGGGGPAAGVGGGRSDEDDLKQLEKEFGLPKPPSSPKNAAPGGGGGGAGYPPSGPPYGGGLGGTSASGGGNSGGGGGFGSGPADFNFAKPAPVPRGGGGPPPARPTQPQPSAITPAPPPYNFSDSKLPASAAGHMTTTERAAAFGASPNLVMEDYQAAKKYCKYAMSALDYEDPGTSIQNLEMAIAVLKKSQPPAHG